MEGSYIQQELVECNRLTSQEALSGNNETPSQWTNTLSNIYELNAGDKVSVHSSFISERGAGSSKTVELKGRNLSKTKSFTYITEEKTKDPVTQRVIQSITTETTEDIQLKDNEVNMIIGYYKNTNGTGYFSQPRQHFGTMGVGGTAAPTTLIPFQVNDSASEGFLDPVVSGNFLIKDDYSLSPYSNGNGVEAIYRVKNDNTKYTLFISQYSKLSNTTSFGINGALGDEPSENYTIDPEYRQFYRYREKLTIEVDKGFNSAQFIANSITKKLQETKSIEQLIYSDDNTKNEDENESSNTVISNMIESNTYKTFNCASSNLMSASDFTAVLNNTGTGTWYNNFQIVGWKRPELYDYGQHINLNTTFSTSITYKAQSNSATQTDSVFIFTGDKPISTTETRLMYLSIPSNSLTPKRATVKHPVSAQDGNKVQEITIIGLTSSSIIGDETPVILEYINTTPTTESTRLLGCQLRTEYTNTTEEPLKTNILYTKDNLDKLKKYIDSQELYSEIWESWNAPQLDSEASAFTYDIGYHDKQTIDNTRFFHMNQVENEKTIEIDSANQIGNNVHEETIYITYNANNPTMLITWDGTTEGLFTPTGDLYYSVVLTDDGRPIVFTGTMNITNSVGDPSGNYQTLTLESGIPHTLIENRNVKITTTTQESYYSFYNNHTMLGSSNYRPAHDTSTISSKRISKLFLVYYNKKDRDVYYDKPSFSLDKLTYGCFGKSEVYDSENDTYTYYIDIYPNKTSTELTFPFNHFKNENDKLEISRKWGYDMHFTAATNPAIGLFNGLTSSANYYGDTFNTAFQTSKYGFNDNNGSEVHQRRPTGTQVKGYINRRYVGADAPRCLWDGEHFSFDSLHTNENLAGRYADGGRYLMYADAYVLGQITADVPQDLGDVIYKINPLQDLNEFCPNITPYQPQKTFYTANGNTEKQAGQQTFFPFNRCYEAFTIFDSKSGIFFEDMGYDEDTWDNGLWGIMGFSYEQFNSNINNRIKRVDNSNVNDLMIPTTNAFIQSTDTKAWNVNENSVPLYTDNIPTTFNLFTYSTTAKAYEGIHKDLTVFPPINQKTNSIQLVARNFPTSMIKGYYTIRSDIVPHSLVVGGRSNITNMPIVGISNKENPQSDYFFGGDSNLEFTIGKPMKLSSITCSIHDPDGSYANVNNSSSVIFKIQRIVKASFNIVDEILQNEEKTKKSKKSKK